MSESG